MLIQDTETETGFPWSDRYLLGHGPMDDTHRAFVDLVDALLTVADADLAVALAALAEHAQAHFEQEKSWMDEGFPARDCHLEEHDKVLASVTAVQAELALGNCALVRDLAQALKDWFPGHADYMDAALAQWLVKRRYAGAPIVLKRFSAVAA